MKLKHRTVLITGGTSGIGLELARALVRLNNTVIITGRDQGRLDKICAEIPGLQAFQSDVADPNSIVGLGLYVSTHFPNLSVLVNNAGIMRNINLLDGHRPSDLTLEIDIGLKGPVQMVNCLLPLLLQQPEAAIVNITSGLAFAPMPIAPIYCAAKSGLHSYSKSLRAQLSGSSVSVFEIAPPGVETPLFRREFGEEMKNQKAMPVQRLVRHAIEAIEAERPETRPGLAGVLYVMSRLAPSLIFSQLSRIGIKRAASGPMI